MTNAHRAGGWVGGFNVSTVAFCALGLFVLSLVTLKVPPRDPATTANAATAATRPTHAR